MKENLNTNQKGNQMNSVVVRIEKSGNRYNAWSLDWLP